MLLKAVTSNMSFRKAIAVRICLSVIIIFTGIKSVFLVLLDQVVSLKSLTSPFGISIVNLESMKGFYTGFGIALIAVGIITIIKSVRLLKNPVKFKKAEIDFGDERNKFMANATFRATSIIFLVALSIAVIASGMFNPIVFVTLLCTFAVYMLILLGVYCIVQINH